MKIVFLEPLGISEELLKEKISSVIDEAEHEIIYYKDRKEDTDTLIERSKDADIVVLSNFKYGREVMESCPSLKMVCVAFTGVDHVDIDYCREKGITVCNCAGYSTSAVADIVFAMVISLARNIIPCQDKARNGGTKDGLVGFELDGKTFGIIGTGAIGTRVAKIANAFGCKVIAYSRTKKDLPDIEFVTMEELLIKSDILFMAVFDTIGTLMGVSQRAGLVDKDGNMVRAKKAFMADAAGSTAGSIFGVTTVGAYIESVTGVESGGRTGLTAVTIGILFLLAMFFAPIILIVPSAATAPALIFVGILMFSVVEKISFKDWTELTPAVIAIVLTPLTYNIAMGIELSILAYVIIKIGTGKFKDVSITMLVLSVIFILKELFTN